MTIEIPETAKKTIIDEFLQESALEMFGDPIRSYADLERHTEETKRLRRHNREWDEIIERYADEHGRIGTFNVLTLGRAVLQIGGFPINGLRFDDDLFADAKHYFESVLAALRKAVDERWRQAK